jgi:hypothetical protein
MKVKVRMLTTMAGPDGVTLAGNVVTLVDEFAMALIGGGYAELLEPEETAPETAELETAALAADVETAVTPAPRPRKRSKRGGKVTDAD